MKQKHINTQLRAVATYLFVDVRLTPAAMLGFL